MNKCYLLDTCGWIWLATGHARIKKSFAVLEQAAIEGRLLFSPISVWEIAMKEAKGLMKFSTDFSVWVEESKRQLNLVSVHLDDDILILSTRLPGTFHGDPADRIIAATARIKDAVVVTGDDKIIQYGKTGLIKVFAI